MFCTRFFRKPVIDESEWPKYSKESPIYYIYDAVNVGHGKGPRAAACEFWNGLMPEIQSFAGEYTFEITSVWCACARLLFRHSFYHWIAYFYRNHHERLRINQRLEK